LSQKRYTHEYYLLLKCSLETAEINALVNMTMDMNNPPKHVEEMGLSNVDCDIRESVILRLV
jgi:hypothetical protein